MQLCYSCSCQYAGQCDRSGPLYVVVESASVVLVFTKQSESVMICKVLELNEASLAKFSLHRLHKLVHKFVVFLADNAALSQSNITWIVQKMLIVRAHV